MKKSLTEEIYPTSIIGKQIIYNKMVNHYKKIYNVKPRIDTNLKVKTSNFIDRSSVFHYNLEDYSRLLPTPPSRLKKRYSQKDRKLKKCQEKMQTEEYTFRPTILDTPIKSKLKDLNEVYHPPRRRPPSITPLLKKEIKPGWTATGTSQPTSPDTKPSSEDSAYTEEDCSEGIPMTKSPEHKPEQMCFRPKNLICIPFLQDITNEILQMGAYSNKELEKVFENHLMANKYNLDEELVKKEINQLENIMATSQEQKINKGYEFGNAEHSYTVSSLLTDNAVLEALKSLNLRPKLKADLIRALDLNLFNSSSCNELFDLNSVNDNIELCQCIDNVNLAVSCNSICGNINDYKEISEQNPKEKGDPFEEYQVEGKTNALQNNEFNSDLSVHSISRETYGKNTPKSPPYSNSHKFEECSQSSSLESIADI